MFIPFCIKTDYTLLSSMITIPTLMTYLKEHKITTCAICDSRLFGTMEFYDACIANQIKPIIGLEVSLDHLPLYLYAQNEMGFQNLLQINTILEKRKLELEDCKLYSKNVLCIVPLESASLYHTMSSIYLHTFVGYRKPEEKSDAMILGKRAVYVPKLYAFSKQDLKYLDILRRIRLGVDCQSDLPELDADVFPETISQEEAEMQEEVANLCRVTFSKDERYIPHYREDIADSDAYLRGLAKQGLQKRLQQEIPEAYQKRLQYELQVISSMGFTDYFLIVYDYVKYAKQNDILVGPGRGSAAGSLVAYAIGIVDIDPMQYHLLFERFLNPERISMPDIDMDFEFLKRDQVISYVKERYGEDKVANIMAYGTLGARQAIHDVGKVFLIDSSKIDRLSKRLKADASLQENYQKKEVASLVQEDAELKKIYGIAMRLEGLKRHVTTHAAGVVISSVPLNTIIPLCKSGDEFLTGYTMNYLEELGLLKMDFLALKNLTIIKNVMELIEKDSKEKIVLSQISLDDEKTMDLFYRVDTVGIFQFESGGMQAFLRKLKPTCFADLIAAVALFRPGPMHNIDLFIARKQKKVVVDYLADGLEDILKETYGVIVYQEQVMQILVRMGKYSYAEADMIRRAMSKKKRNVMEKERASFIKRACANGYSKEVAEKVYDYILSFAEYGFNKAHSVCYALIGYQMAYLKSHYPAYFIANLLNMSLGSEVKTKEYLDEAKKHDLLILKPDINESGEGYTIKDGALRLPLSVIKNIGASTARIIIQERASGPYLDFFDFACRTYGKGINRKAIEILIDADVFASFHMNHHTLHENLDHALNYAELISNLDASLVMKPVIEEKEEYDSSYLMECEMACYGFYVTNHPASKYQSKKIVKCDALANYFDRQVDMVVLVESIRKIQTKKKEDMAFVAASDETGKGDFVFFPKKYSYLLDVRKGDLVFIRGLVTRRDAAYQLNVISLQKDFDHLML